MEWPGLRPVLVLLSGEAEERVWEAHTCKKPTLILCTGCLVHHGRCGAKVCVGCEKTLLLNVCVQEDFCGFRVCKARGDRLVVI